jgi:putative transcriptional regulator
MVLTENKIKFYRTKKGLTQEELADALRVTRQTIIAIEKGKYTPSLELAFKLSRFFKEKIETLFCYD